VQIQALSLIHSGIKLKKIHPKKRIFW